MKYTLTAITYEALAKLLQLPETAKIVDIKEGPMSFSTTDNRRAIHLKVQGVGPEVPEGIVIPYNFLEVEDTDTGIKINWPQA